MKNTLRTLGILLLFTFNFLNSSIAQEEEASMIVDQNPRFPGCEEMDGTKDEIEGCAQKKMLEYIYGNLKYPLTARQNDIQGTVIVQFTVLKDGFIDEVTLLQGLEGGCSEESLEIVEAMNELPNRWTPGKQKGQAVNVIYTLPIKFKLEEKKKKKSFFKRRNK